MGFDEDGEEEFPPLFRSEDMTLLQFVMQKESSVDIVRDLGKQGRVQFVDQNPHLSAFEREWVAQVRRCEELERMMRHFRSFFARLGIDDTVDHGDERETDREGVDIDFMQDLFEEVESELNTLTSAQHKVAKQVQVLQEHAALLAVGEAVFQNVVLPAGLADSIKAADAQVDAESGRGGAGAVGARYLNSISGLVPREKQRQMERLVFRACRGNVLLRYHDIDTSKWVSQEELGETTPEREWVAFVLFVSGSVARQKVAKLCDMCDAHQYEVPQSSSDAAALASDIDSSLKDALRVVAVNRDRTAAVLQRVAPRAKVFRSIIREEKAVYHILNTFAPNIGAKALGGAGGGAGGEGTRQSFGGGGLFVAEGWCPTRFVNDVRRQVLETENRVNAGTHSMVNAVLAHSTPPTYIETNKFTRGFQDLVDAYGIARYKEINPGVFTVITYPFLFGVMFGDMGHGMIMVLFSLYLIGNEKKLGSSRLGEIGTSVFEARFVLLLLGLFSVYCGLIYNECFGVSMDLFGTGWEMSYAGSKSIGTYPIGADPAWAIAQNKLNFFNSLKMKLSIILGVVHMLFGIAAKYANSIYFKRWKDLFFECIPETLFLLSIFGYLCALIIVKWLIDWPAAGLVAPPLLDTLIQMFLRVGGKVPAGDHLFNGQSLVQLLLICVAVCSVPVLLLAKPLLLINEHRHGYRAIQPTGSDTEAMALQEEEDDGHSGFDPSELIIHQVIHTIEFVIGCVSNTASYLRLWALSLAHSELSEVFWHRVVLLAIPMEGFTGVLALVAAIALWACLTFGVLMLMETMSAALHDIRLHWVEYQNKFYSGDGHKFNPFSFTTIHDAARVEEEESAPQ